MANQKFIAFVCFIGLFSLTVMGQDTSPATIEPPTSSAPDPTTAPDMPKMKCTKPGFMCMDCNTQAMCIGMENEEFKQMKSGCQDGSHCVVDKCVPGAKCNSKKFDCTDEGFFPDPYECTKYQICMRVGDGKYTGMKMNCGEGRGSYDASSKTCGYPLNSTACLEGPVPRCEIPLQTGALTTDPSIYYVCTDDGEKIGPELYRCSGGMIFDTKAMSCVPSKKMKKK